MRHMTDGSTGIPWSRFTVCLVIGSLLLLPQWATAASEGTWVQQAPVGAAGSLPTLQLQCPSADVCYAFGLWPGASGIAAGTPLFEKTTDGGVTWNGLSVTGGLYTSGRSPLACPSVTVCYLLSSTAPWPPPSAPVSIRVTTDGGKTWINYPTGIEGSPDKISCPSAAVCYVSVYHGEVPVSLDLLVTTDGGHTWSSRSISVTTGSLGVLTCPGVHDCYVSGSLVDPGTGSPADIAVTHDGGQTWTVVRAPRSNYPSIACPSIDHCYALSSPPIVTRDGGQTWTAVPTTVDPIGKDMVCPSDSVCYIAAGRIWRTTDAGTSWHPAADGDPLGIFSLSCPTTTTCYGTGEQGLVLKTTDGETWEEPTPYTRRALHAIACPTATTCFAAGDYGTVLVTANAGVQWVRHSTGTNGDIVSLACPAVDVCLAEEEGPGPDNGANHVVLRTTDGGRSWAQEAGVQAFGLSCFTQTFCVAAGTPPHFLRSFDGGKTWHTRSGPRRFPLAAFACVSTARCIGVGGNSSCEDCVENGWLFTTTDGGEHWHRQYAYGSYLVSVACSTAIRCYAGGHGIWLRSTFQNGKWTVNEAATVPPTAYVRSVSCPAASTCWGVGMQENSTGGIPVRTRNGGRSWTVVEHHVSGDVEALTCPRPDECFAVGPSGLIMAYSP